MSHKHYVCSDIHSHLDIFIKALLDTTVGSTTHVIGDVIDKGPDGIKALVLCYILESKCDIEFSRLATVGFTSDQIRAIIKLIADNKHVELLLGNHELMLLKYIEAITYEDKKQEAFLNKWWLDRNKGYATLEDFNRITSKDNLLKMELYTYLTNLPIVKRLDINSRTVILCHANPLGRTRDLYYRDLPLPLVDLEYVWSREIPKTVGKEEIVVGHTIVPTHYNGTNEIYKPSDHVYMIDMGLALSEEACKEYKLTSQLAIMDLEDNKVIYSQNAKA